MLQDTCSELAGLFKSSMLQVIDHFLQTEALTRIQNVKDMSDKKSKDEKKNKRCKIDTKMVKFALFPILSMYFSLFFHFYFFIICICLN